MQFVVSPYPEKVFAFGILQRCAVFKFIPSVQILRNVSGVMNGRGKRGGDMRARKVKVASQTVEGHKVCEEEVVGARI